MKVTHEFRAFARCPFNKHPDVYEVKVSTDRLILAEDVMRVCTEYRDVEISQERLTRKLSEALNAEVTTAGYHGPVRTTCTVTP